MTRRPGHRFGFVMEQTLGNVTYYKNVREAVERAPEVSASWYPLTFPPRGTLETLPPIRRNWSLRASLRARRLLQAADAAHVHDALLFHTQVPTLLSVGLMHRVPTVISLDATPRAFDTLATGYGHATGHPLVEGLKDAINRRPLQAARAIISFSQWAARSLTADYGIGAERMTVIPPGIDLAHWPTPSAASGEEPERPLRLLFVGGDFERKGGPLLLEAIEAGRAGACEVHVVSRAVLAPRPYLHLYTDLQPNSAELKALYASCDLFVLPTLADISPWVIPEAMAVGLPVVASDVAAIGEIVHEGETGLLVPPGDGRALGAALDVLLTDPVRRRAMGRQWRAIAEQKFNSAINVARILEVMASVASEAP